MHDHKFVTFKNDEEFEKRKIVAEKIVEFLNQDYEIINTTTPQDGGVIYILCKNDKT